jgi:hypothetical protein
VIFTLIWLSGALVYVILWIAMPEARTTAEKLQMRGEKVNINNIEKSIREEVTHLKDKLNDLTSQTKKKVAKAGKDSENVFEQIAGLFVSILKVILKVLVVIIGILLLLTGIGLTLGFLFAVFGWGGPLILENDEAILLPLQHFFTLLPLSAGGSTILKLGLILFIGIPLVMLMYNAFRMIFGIERIKYVGITALNVWIIGLIITLFFSFRIAREYRQEGLFTETIEIDQPAGDTLFITINEELLDELLYDTYDFIRGDNFHLVVTEAGVFYEQVELDLNKSMTDEFMLTRLALGRGRTLRAAKEQAESTAWNHQQKGDTLIFDPFFEVGKRGQWRAQHIELKLDIPVGKYIHLDEGMREILHWGRYNPRKLAGRTWFMTENGLEQADGGDVIIPTTYYPEEAEPTSGIKPILIRMVSQVW